MTKYLYLFIFCLLSGSYSYANEDKGKLVATSGLIQIEGAGGGGLVPWATLSGYDTQDDISMTANMTRVSVKDYKMLVFSMAASFYDRFELSLAKQELSLDTLGGQIRQDVIGVKYKISSDALFSEWPQISAGIQHKSLQDTAIANALGAKSTSGTDFYLAATKIHLGAIAGYNAVWNVTARATKANEIGLLGFGSQTDDSYDVMLEASAGMLFSRHIAVGFEYRQKPDNLGLKEDDWFDVFITYIPNKSASFTFAWTDLGTVAGAPNQQGFYLSLNGHLF